MNSFNTISYNNGVLTINGIQYDIEAGGNSINGNSFSQIKLEDNKLTINGVEIALTEYQTRYLKDVNNKYLRDTNSNNLGYGNGIENQSLLLTDNNEILNDKYGMPLEFA